MSDEVMKVIDELNDFLADVYYPLLDEFQRHEHALTKEKAKEFKEKFEKVLKKLEEFRNTLKEHLARLIAEGKDELASNVKNTIEFIENEMANVIRILERLKRNRHKIAIKWGEKEISLADLVSFSKHAKELHIDGDRKTAIIVEPDERLLEELENRGVKYEVIE